MTTVTAKQLRENLSDIIDRVEDGEEIVVIRRSRPAIRLMSETAISQERQINNSHAGNRHTVLAGIERYQAYAKAAGIIPETDPKKSFKELYHELMNADPKYASYVAETPKTEQ
jgi:prevent-host-death family protein